MSGWGEGVQKLFYLPEAHTDFLFAVLAEEFGLAGMVATVGLYTFLVLRALAIGRHAEVRESWFAAYTAYGIGLLLGLHAFINIGVNIGPANEGAHAAVDELRRLESGRKCRKHRHSDSNRSRAQDVSVPGGVMTRLLVVAAGTGGHVYPALAVAERLRAMGVDVFWLGTAAGIESRLVPAAGIPLHVSGIAGLRGKGIVRWLVAPMLLLRSGLRSMVVLARVRPHVVLGMGGYGAGPGGLAARLFGIPLVIHEQNAVPGLTNRILAWFATRVLEAFPASFMAKRHASIPGTPFAMRSPTPRRGNASRTP